MENWKIIIDPVVQKKIDFFKTENPKRAGEIDRVLAEILKYPFIRWATVFPESGKFHSDSNRQIRFAGQAVLQDKAIYITHFSVHI